jgi:hypothetical protein
VDDAGAAGLLPLLTWNHDETAGVSPWKRHIGRRGSAPCIGARGCRATGTSPGVPLVERARPVGRGAYLAWEYLEPSFVPSIVPLLRHEHPDVQLAAIDALLRLNADVPAESLGPFRIDGRFDPILALLSRNPKKYAGVLMSLLDQSLDDEEWLAVNSILWTAPPHGYAARLLSRPQAGS